MELGSGRRLAGEQLRLRPLEHAARPASKDLLTALKLTNPRAIQEPNAHIDRYIARRREIRTSVGGGQGLLSRPAPMRRPDPTTPSLLGLPLAWLGVFFLLPVALVAGYSLDVFSLDPGAHPITLAGWHDFFHTPVYLRLFWKSIQLSLIVSAIVVGLSYPVAYFLAMSGTKRKYILLLILIAPFLTSYLLRVLAWKVILGNNGVLNSFLYWTHLRAHDHPISQLLYSKFAVMLVLAYIWVPFVALPIFVSLESLDRRLLEAATDLGASRLQSFVRVTLPLSAPGVMAAFLFVFIPTVGEFVTPSLVGGTSGYLYGNQITDLFGTGFPDWRTGSVLAVFLLAVVAVLPASSRASSRCGRCPQASGRRALHRGRRVLAGLFVLLVIFLYAPILLLLVFSFNDRCCRRSRSAGSRSTGTASSCTTASCAARWRPRRSSPRSRASARSRSGCSRRSRSRGGASPAKPRSRRFCSARSSSPTSSSGSRC